MPNPNFILGNIFKSLPNLQIFVFDFLAEDTSDVRSQGNVFSYCLTERNKEYFGNCFVTSEAKTWQGKSKSDV
jgi:hypothetical protein